MYTTKISVNEEKGIKDLIDYPTALHYEVVPFKSKNEGLLYCATPRNIGSDEYRKLRFLFGKDILMVKTDQDNFSTLLDNTWSKDERQAKAGNSQQNGFKAKVVKDATKSNQDKVLHLDLSRSKNDVSVVNLVDRLFSQAISSGVSDIHLEPSEHEMKVRLRVDGVLQNSSSINKHQQNELISRIKILARMDIAEKRRPQDGRILVEGNNKEVDVRVSSMLTPNGEKIVMRLLDKEQQPLDLNSLGMVGRNYEMFGEAIRKPHGMILVTGPTGSGKTTTLYAALKEIHSPRINISTVEDPIEYQINGINQTQMHQEIGYTFASAVRTFLRQDPDVIMIGEIRDSETAKYAIQAAQTGHLVFSTLHTNDAPSAIIRLLEMGMEPFLVASTVHLIMAQRLVRKTCTHCGEQRNLSDGEMKYAGKQKWNIQSVFEGKGCEHCNDTGYKGRVGVFEIMQVSNEIQDLVISKASTQRIRDTALEQGMSNLLHEGKKLIIDRVSTIDEVQTVLG